MEEEKSHVDQMVKMSRPTAAQTAARILGVIFAAAALAVVILAVALL